MVRGNTRGNLKRKREKKGRPLRRIHNKRDKRFIWILLVKDENNSKRPYSETWGALNGARKTERLKCREAVLAER